MKNTHICVYTYKINELFFMEFIYFVKNKIDITNSELAVVIT